jgi:hypothetical protein
MRGIDKGLAASKIGLVLVTPALLGRLPKEGVADQWSELKSEAPRELIVSI